MRGRNNCSTPRPASQSLANSFALVVSVFIFCGHATAQPLEPIPPGAESAADPAPTPTQDPSPPTARPPAQSPVPAANVPDATSPSSAAPEPLRGSPPAGEAPTATTPPQPAADSEPTAAAPIAPSALPPPASAPPTQVLPHDLSPWGMFMAADIVVKAVMIGLALASLLTWTVWFAKSLELSAARRSLKKALITLTRSTSLADAAQRIGTSDRHARALIEQAELELRLSSDVLTYTGAARDRIGTRLQQVVASAGRTMNRGTGVLATIGSTAPFIGLFGTVWGIMNSFIGISKSQTTNLAIVAPGIAEALLATAIGLVAAIPAVIIYNNFSRSISSYKALLVEAASEVMRHVSRDLDRGLQAQPLRAAAE